MSRRVLIVDVAASCTSPHEMDLFFGAPTGLFSKALRDTAKTLNVDVLGGMGIIDEVIWAQVLASCSRLAANNARTCFALLVDLKVGYLRGRAKLLSATTVEVCCHPKRTRANVLCFRLAKALPPGTHVLTSTLNVTGRSARWKYRHALDQLCAGRDRFHANAHGVGAF